jgi:hypothetical protein
MRWRSQQNEHKPVSQRLELAHPPKEPLYAEKAICAVGSPERESGAEASVPPAPRSESESRQSELTVFGRSASETVERDGGGRVGTIRILVESVIHGTVLVGSSRQPFLDAVRVLIASGYDPHCWLEAWRPGATVFALRGHLRIAAGLTVDETKTAFAKWKAFSSSAVASHSGYSEVPATTPAAAPSAHLQPPPDQPFSGTGIERKAALTR